MHILGEKSKEPQTRTAELKRAKPYRPEYNHEGLGFRPGGSTSRDPGFPYDRIRP